MTAVIERDTIHLPARGNLRLESETISPFKAATMTNTYGRAGNWITLLLPALLGLAGCAARQPDRDLAAAATESQAAATEASARQQPEPPPLRPFESETLFDLLVADIAGIEGQYGLQLNRYRKQALATRDPGVAARATWLAVQFNATPQALELSQLWVSLAPDNVDANRIAAHYLAHSKQLPRALPHALFALQHQDTEAIRTIAGLINRTGSEQQRKLLAQLQSLAAGQARYRETAAHPEVMLIKANLLRLQGRYQQAIDQANRVQQPRSSRESALLLIARAVLQRDGPDAALASLQQSLLSMPGSKRLRLQLARQWAEKDLRRSRQELNKLVDRFPDDHRLIYSLALINAQLGFPEQAKTLLKQLLNSPQHRDNAHFQLGRLLEQQGDRQQAIEHYRQVKGGQNATVAQSRLVQLLAAAGDRQAVESLLQRLRQQQPGDEISAYRLVAQALAGGQHLQWAHQVLSEALAAAPDNSDLLYDRSLVSEQSSDTVNSHRDLRKVIAQDPNHAAALNALGYSLSNHSNQFQEAHQLISRALELEPDNPAIIDSLGWVLFRLNRHQQAVTHLRKALAMLPDPEVAAHLGEVLWVMGNHEEALQVWRRNLADNPGPSFVTRTMERLGVPQATEHGAAQ